MVIGKRNLLKIAQAKGDVELIIRPHADLLTNQEASELNQETIALAILSFQSRNPP